MKSDSNSTINKLGTNVLETHRIVLNFTENSMKLYNNETDIAFKVYKRHKSETTLNDCIDSLLTNGVFNRNVSRIKNICTTIHSIYCDFNCNKKK